MGWTADLIRRGLNYYASAVEGTTDAFRAEVQDLIDGRVAALARQVSRLEAERVAIIRRAKCGRARVASAALLPPEQFAERMMKYEKHLHGQLISTLHELERLQARRGGMTVLPPAVADLNVTVNGY